MNGFRNIVSLAVAFIVTCAVTTTAQSEPDTVGSLPGIQIETSVDKAEAYIGDLITYTLTITYDSTYSLTPPPLGANLGSFDVKDYKPDIETELPEGRLQSQTTFVLSTFTTGDYTIPALPVLFTLPDSSQTLVLAEPIPISILSMLESEGDSLDIRGLKPQFEFPRVYTKYYLWGGLSLFLLAAAVLTYVYIRRRRRSEELLDLRPPWEISYEKLALLSEANLCTQGKHKEHYLALTEITRGYLGRIYERDVLEMTTEQFHEAFDDTEMPGKLFEELAEFYDHADRVKFAKHVPEVDRTEEDFSFAHEMIGEVKEDFEKRQQPETVIEAAADQDVTKSEEVAP